MGPVSKANEFSMREPACKFWLQLFAQVWTHVQITHAGAAAKPLQNAAAGEVGIERLNVDGDGAERLEGVEHDVGANFVGFFDDGFGVVECRSCEK